MKTLPYSDDLKNVLEEAKEIASENGFEEVSPVHLLLGLMKDEEHECAARLILRIPLNLQGGEMEAVWIGVSQMLRGHVPVWSDNEPSLSKSVKAILRFAENTALNEECGDIGTDHVLLGILARTDFAEVLKKRGVSLEKVRRFRDTLIDRSVR